MVRRFLPLLAAALGMVACGGEKTPPASSPGTTQADTGHPMAMGGMAAMPHRDTIAERTTADLDRLSKTGPDSVKALLPAHRTVVTNLIADCDRMMRDMKMTPPSKWTSATAAIRADLDRMPSMNTVQLKGFIPEHRKRVDDILSMRHDMMSKM